MDFGECFINGRFAATKKGALELAKLNMERVPKS
jgi:hypothetical protein